MVFFSSFDSHPPTRCSPSVAKLVVRVVMMTMVVAPAAPVGVEAMEAGASVD